MQSGLPWYLVVVCAVMWATAGQPEGLVHCVHATLHVPPRESAELLAHSEAPGGLEMLDSKGVAASIERRGVFDLTRPTLKWLSAWRGACCTISR